MNNEIASWNWSCPFCETRDPMNHRSDCKGLLPEAVQLRRMYGQPWPTDEPAGVDGG